MFSVNCISLLQDKKLKVVMYQSYKYTSAISVSIYVKIGSRSLSTSYMQKFGDHKSILICTTTDNAWGHN
jgi:hypothetical protein